MYRLAVCGCGNKLTVYSVKTGKLLRKLEGHHVDIVDFFFNKKNLLQVLNNMQYYTIMESICHSLCQICTNP